MILLKLKAGLGNQLFQYAYGRALALRNKTDLKLDISSYRSMAARDTKREYGLGVFNIKAEIASEAETARYGGKLGLFWRKSAAKFRREILGQSDYVFYPRLNRLPDGSFVEGFWNTEKYFKEFNKEIRNELTLRAPLGAAAQEMEQKLKTYASSGETIVLIHVRRGDYLSNQFAASHHGAQGIEYYKLAVARMLELLKPGAGSSGTKIRFMLASDDMQWTSENISPLLEEAAGHADIQFHIENLSNSSEIKDYEETYLMSLCHHFIIANSSFSWWGAWLSETASHAGKKKIVIGPKRWVANPSVDTRDVLPEEWIRV